EGRNGLYTEILLQHIRIPGLKIEDVFKRVGRAVVEKSKGEQVPWVNTSLYEDFYFTPPALAVPKETLTPSPPPTSPPVPPPPDEILTFWGLDPKTGQLVPQSPPLEKSMGGSGKTPEK